MTSTKVTAAALRDALAQVDTEIIQWKARLAQLEARREGILDSLDTIVYPVLSLPVEITAEIFRHYVERAWIGGPSNTQGPVVLAAVCRTWREIALSLPALWSNIWLDGMENDPDEERKQMERLFALHLARTGQHPLKLDANTMSFDESFAQRLIGVSARWEELSLQILSPDVFPQDILHLPALRDLCVTCDSDEFLDNDSEPIIAFSDAPALRKLQLSDVLVEMIVLPWAQLTELVLKDLFPHHCVEILAHTTSLRDLTLEQTRTPHDPAAPVITSSTVTMLKIRGYMASELAVVDFLTLPALEELQVAVPDSPERYDRLSDFVRRSRCELKSLSITHIDEDLHATLEDAGGLPRFLSDTPSVTTLNITRMGWESLNRLLVHLDVFRWTYLQQPATQCMLPNLENLEIAMEGPRIPYPEMVDTLQQRRFGERLEERPYGDSEMATAQLKRFWFRIPKIVWGTVTSEEKILEWRAKGHDIDVDDLRIFRLDAEEE
ncbi:F-box domain-containing protein [Mycena chlorophos]|uniref:F-box domain-containing protein n=1 Tax=Mycena chlorophos TaxID=658473 RepID=A0A8H6TLG7_MYCCL|nr:F-box domain-containing protein [Mycena chlorophos]